VPHLLLEEAFWDEPTQTAMHRYYVIDAATTAVSRFAETMQAWSDDDYRTLLSEAGFRTESILPSLTGGTESGDLVVVVGHTAD
jgi:hypothetical protein